MYSSTTNLFQGAWTALATPFNSNGTSVDLNSLKQLVEYQISNKIDGIVACGSTGESATLSSDEYFSVIDETIKISAGRTPVVAGIGTNNTALAVELTKKLNSRKLAGIMVTAPAYNKPTQDGIIAHFHAVRAATSLPLIGYNVPGRSGINITPQTFAKLVRDGTLTSIKEACGSMDQILDLLSLTKDTSVTVLSGDDSLTLPLMASGGYGVISVLSNVAPVSVKKITDLCLSGNYAEAKKLSLTILPLTRALFAESNPIPVKAALKIKGIITSDFVRLPLIPAQSTTINLLTELLGNERS